MPGADVVIVGAGATGLALGATLRRRGIPAVILDRDDRVGGSWARRYERLHLDTVRRFSGLPYQALPSSLPRYVPTQAYAGDAGLDLAAAERVVLEPGARATVGTGLAVAIPEGYAGYVQPRSGLAARHGITIVNAPGLVDSGYRGELRVILLNTDREAPFTVEPGMRIAQLVVLPVPGVELVEVDELPESERGVRGFGSSAS